MCDDGVRQDRCFGTMDESLMALTMLLELVTEIAEPSAGLTLAQHFKVTPTGSDNAAVGGTVMKVICTDGVACGRCRLCFASCI